MMRDGAANHARCASGLDRKGPGVPKVELQLRGHRAG
jgi:hypothetical protein